MCPHCNVEATVAVGENLLEIGPMKRLATLEENMEKFFGDELVDKCLPLFCRELRPFARAAIGITELAVHIAGLGNADGEFEGLVEFRDLLPFRRL